MQQYVLVWITEASDSPFLIQLGERGPLALPHVVLGSGGADVSLTPSAKTLSLGILLVAEDDMRYVAEPVPTDAQCLKLLQWCAREFRLATEDELCVHASAYMAHYAGEELRPIILRKAIRLLHHAPLCQDDLRASEPGNA